MPSRTDEAEELGGVGVRVGGGGEGGGSHTAAPLLSQCQAQKRFNPWSATLSETLYSYLLQVLLRRHSRLMIILGRDT